MQVDRIAGVARVAGSVRGLGVCDVLRVELAPVQHAGLEAELTGRIAGRDQRRAELVAAARVRTGPSPGADGALARIREELRLLARLRDGMPPLASEPYALTGPAGLVLELVGACLESAVRHADARLAAGESCAPGAGTCERELEAAAAWIATALDCRAVEDFCFEPDVDPPHAW
jgi:hypothetical protein